MARGRRDPCDKYRPAIGCVRSAGHISRAGRPGRDADDGRARNLCRTRATCPAGSQERRERSARHHPLGAGRARCVSAAPPPLRAGSGGRKAVVDLSADFCEVRTGGSWSPFRSPSRRPEASEQEKQGNACARHAVRAAQ